MTEFEQDYLTIGALEALKVETGSLACLGCGYEHNCGLHGCAIINRAVASLRQKENLAAELVECRAQLQALEKAIDTGQLVRAPRGGLADICPAVAGGGA